MLGRDGAYHIFEQGAGIHPSSGQIDFYLVIPLCIAFLLATVAWFANGFQRWFNILGAVAAISLFALIPYVLASGGGV
jgi:hypothetical protein